MKVFQSITNGFKRVVFPNVCVCCGHEHTEEQRQICSFCLRNRFEVANPNNKHVSSDSLLPDGVMVQHALWEFDKGGDLQNLLHQLKYERLITIGRDLGRRLGLRIQSHPTVVELFKSHESVIVPVPLHYRKYRYRGFNQAFTLAQGFCDIWDSILICDIDDVVRIKNTSSQTGFSLEKRIDNIQKAFRVRNKELINNRLCIIIDDVFTTGATTFELAETLRNSGAEKIIILTVAQA